jgi:hypothetical protein
MREASVGRPCRHGSSAGRHPKPRRCSSACCRSTSCHACMVPRLAKRCRRIGQFDTKAAKNRRLTKECLAVAPKVGLDPTLPRASNGRSKQACLRFESSAAPLERGITYDQSEFIAAKSTATQHSFVSLRFFAAFVSNCPVRRHRPRQLQRPLRHMESKALAQGWWRQGRLCLPYPSQHVPQVALSCRRAHRRRHHTSARLPRRSSPRAPSHLPRG